MEIIDDFVVNIMHFDILMYQKLYVGDIHIYDEMLDYATVSFMIALIRCLIVAINALADHRLILLIVR